MKLFLSLVLYLLSGLAGAQELKYAAAGGAQAVPLSRDNAYFRAAENPAPDYWALSSFYVPQFNDYACSAASVAMAANALLNARRVRGNEENVTQEGLLEKVTGFNWKALLSAEGENGRHGLTYAQLAAASREALAAYGAVKATVAGAQVTAQTAAGLEAFRRALSGGERSPNDVMLLHFTQDTLTGDKGGPYPHISPVGAYDEANRRVLIFDVDRKYYEPYWAADTQVYKAMAARTPAFGSGGYVILRLAK